MPRVQERPNGDANQNFRRPGRNPPSPVTVRTGFHPEGITSADDGTLYIGSLTTGGIQRVPPSSTTAEEFVADGAIAERGVVGVTVDDERDLVWFCDSSPAAETPGGAIVGVSTAATAAATDGDEAVRHALPDGAGADVARPAFCNDLIVTPDGDIFDSESWRGSRASCPDGYPRV